MKQDKITENISRELYGKSFAQLTKEQKYRVQDEAVEAYAAIERKGHGFACTCWACCL